MAAEWYYKELGQDFGPISTAQLQLYARTGEIGPDTFVRNGSNGKWVAACRVKGLFDVSAKPNARTVPATRPTPKTPASTTSNDDSVERDESDWNQAISSKIFLRATGGLLSVGLVIGVVWLVLGNSSPSRTRSDGKGVVDAEQNRRAEADHARKEQIVNLEKARVAQDELFRQEQAAKHEAERRAQEAEQRAIKV